jgi:2-methylisocitrate lyase-like PEP mutase family enzyme
MLMETKKTTRYREYINRPEIAVCVGVQDCIGARLVEQTGFDLAFVHDFGLSATFLGQPDMGLITLTEMTLIIEKIIKSVELPVIADGGCGFGNPLNTHRTVEEFESIGAAGVNIEDQVYPKRCGHLAGKEIISTEEMNDKIQAACDARKDEDFVIVARTDAIAVDGVDEAILRGNAYARAGADMIFVEAPETQEDIARIVKSLEAPCWVNMVEGGKTPLVPVDELQKMGAALVDYGPLTLLAASAAIAKVLKVLKEDGITTRVLDELISFQEMNQLTGLPKYRDMEVRYGREKS